MKTFYKLLANTMIASITNNFVWFAVTYWIYLETQSVLATSFVGGGYLVATALSGMWFGSLVDHNKKKHVMVMSSIGSLVLYSLGALMYAFAPASAFDYVSSFYLWLLVAVLLIGVVIGNLRSIVLPTCVTLLVEEDERDKANGMSGTVFGIAFSITSFASGIALGYGGMGVVVVSSILLTILALVHLSLLNIPEDKIVSSGTSEDKKVDIKGTIRVIKSVPGLPALIFFNVINNLLGGVFMALMDAYGLSLVSVQAWGTLWGVISFGFIIGGLIIAKRGVGKNPLRTLFLTNIILWIIAILFTIQPWIWLFVAGMLLYISLIPFVEASEQTILQKVVPLERQGRVFGFAQSVEQSASPFTAFLIGPIAQFMFIPFMTTGKGVELIGGWFGTGTGRGLALVFVITGIIGLVITLLAMTTESYRLLTKRYLAK